MVGLQVFTGTRPRAQLRLENGIEKRRHSSESAKGQIEAATGLSGSRSGSMGRRGEGGVWSREIFEVYTQGPSFFARTCHVASVERVKWFLTNLEAHLPEWGDWSCPEQTPGVALSRARSRSPPITSSQSELLCDSYRCSLGTTRPLWVIPKCIHPSLNSKIVIGDYVRTVFDFGSSY